MEWCDINFRLEAAAAREDVPATSCAPQINPTSSHIEMSRFFYTFHTLIEPLLALSGSLQLLLFPTIYLSYMPVSTFYHSSSRLLYNQLGFAYLCIALLEALVLRNTREIKAWTAVVVGMLVCDGGHAYAHVMEIGVRMWEWGWWDVLTMGLTVGLMVSRTGWLMGVF